MSGKVCFLDCVVSPDSRTGLNGIRETVENSTCLATKVTAMLVISFLLKVHKTEK
jgi:hypothetical protein